MNTKEQALASQMLDDYAETLSNRSCNDWDFPEDWTPEEARAFAAEVSTFGREGDPIPERDDFPVLMDTEVAGYLARLLDPSNPFSR